jgi:mRNA interferase HicA
MKYSVLIRLLERNGWVTVSQKGSHLKMKHPHHSAVLIVPNHGSQELGKGLEMKIKK